MFSCWTVPIWWESERRLGEVGVVRLIIAGLHETYIYLSAGFRWLGEGTHWLLLDCFR